MAGRKDGLWRHPDFRSLWMAQSISLLGTQISVLAFPMMALLVLHASPTDVSMLAAVEFLPFLLFGLPAGAWLDWLPHRPVMIVCDIVRAAAMASVPIAYALHVLRLPLLFLVAFVIGLGTLFFDVAQLSYPPALIDEDDLPDGNAKLEGSRAFAQFAGPGVGGFLVQLASAPTAIAANVGTYVVSALFLSTVRGHNAPTEKINRLSLRKEIAEGIRFVFSQPLIRPLALCAGFADLAFAAVLALQIPYGVDTLHLDSAAIGLVLAVGSIGGLLGAALSAKGVERFGIGASLLASVALFSIGAALIPLAHGAVLFSTGLFVVYLGVVVFNVLQTTVCQTITPSRLLSRMNATLRFITWGAVPLGASAGGALVDPLGLRGVLWSAAGVCAFAILPLLFSRIPRLTGDLSALQPGSLVEPAQNEPISPV